ncbi:hypothetical protein WMY93_017645 [Mugilogobius chulae]|uniref:Uncharacterized protein n=1 Tax=Mugilogobius chulae TaxID=88201 RepID=A0AAW0NQ08_9GOBI
MYKHNWRAKLKKYEKDTGKAKLSENIDSEQLRPQKGFFKKRVVKSGVKKENSATTEELEKNKRGRIKRLGRILEEKLQINDSSDDDEFPDGSDYVRPGAHPPQ